MQWTDEGIVLGTRRHGETSAIVEVMTRARGRHLGLVRGGAGSRLRPVLQPGNTIRVDWRARLEEHLGNYTVEGLRLRAGDLLTVAHAIYGVTHLAALCRLLPERDPHPEVHDLLEGAVDHLEDATIVAVNVVRFELRLLAELGFGLDLDACVATGAREDLIYVSPKSGRAVSATAGQPWRDRLLRLPSFLTNETLSERPSPDELRDGFALTGFFLTRHVLEPRNLTYSESRQSLAAIVGGLVPAMRANPITLTTRP
jgi:DNA repair protein RecO (recombination protein O)